MRFNPAKVLLNSFAVLFKILWVHYTVHSFSWLWKAIFSETVFREVNMAFFANFLVCLKNIFVEQDAVTVV